MADTREREDGEPTYGQITDDGVARLRQRIGIPVRNPSPPRYREPGLDAFRIVAQAYGDDNPLWSDRDYAAKTRWGEPVAPPAMVGGDTLIGEDDLVEIADEHKQLLKGDPLKGVHAFYSGSSREWWAPLTAGRRIRRRDALVGVHDKPSEFAGRAIHEWTGQIFAAGTSGTDNSNKPGSPGADAETGVTPLSAQYKLMIRTERTKAREKKKYAAIEPYVYTEAEIEAIERAVLRERPRGNEPRYWEDVHAGDVIDGLVKGPLTVTDIVCWHAGVGMGLYNVRPLGLAVKNRQRIKGFYHRDELGVPDVMQRVHWDPEFARRSGNPTTFDYGRMREFWFIHACTNWMGDDAWLWKLTAEFRAFNYVGDTQWITGTVVNTHLAGAHLAGTGLPVVGLELTATNQRGEITTTGTATIVLPSRKNGAFGLPKPPGDDLQSVMSATIEGFARDVRP
jgi:acyl dehydratase